MKAGVIGLLGIGGAIMLSLSAHAEVWTHTNKPAATSPAISADGSVFVVGGGTATYVSYDYGTTWRSNNFRGSAVSISANGTKIIVGSPGAFYTSGDAGMTWTTQSNPPTFGPFNNPRQIAAAGDGNRLALVLYGTCPIFTSTDGGATWSTNNDAPLKYWTGIASSADGIRLAAGSADGVWISTNSGMNWFSTLTSNAMVVASSADGKRLVASGNNEIFVSGDFGSTWSSQEIQNLYASAASSSADGTRLGLACYLGIFMSTNSGVTWSNANVAALGWDSLAESADGHRWMAHSGGSGALFIGASPPAPELQIAPANPNVSISWTVPSSPFILQQRASIEGGNWTTVAEPVVMNLNTLRNEVSVAASNSCSFFRLSSP
jgi:photosystem II stability/assembly factor-like uncharacterized protein